MRTVLEEGLEVGKVLRGGYYEDVPDASHHQDRERIVDHRLVVYRQQMLVDGRGHRVEAGAASPGQDYSLHGWVSIIHLILSHTDLIDEDEFSEVMHQSYWTKKISF